MDSKPCVSLSLDLPKQEINCWDGFIYFIILYYIILFTVFIDYFSFKTYLGFEIIQNGFFVFQHFGQFAAVGAAKRC